MNQNVFLRIISNLHSMTNSEKEIELIVIERRQKQLNPIQLKFNFNLYQNLVTLILRAGGMMLPVVP